MKSKRIVWIDQLKGIGFFFVILGHLEINDTLQQWVYSFHMPLFLIVTGLTFNFEKAFRSDFKTFLSARIKRLIVPFFWLSMISLSILYIRRIVLGGDIPDLTDQLRGILLTNTKITLVSPAPALYYVILLFLSELVLWVFIKLTKNNKLYIFLLILACLPASLLTINVPVVFHLNVVPVSMLMIFIGRVLMDFYKSGGKEKLESLSADKYAFLCIVLLLTGSALALVNGRTSLHGNKYGHDFMASLVCALLINVAIALITMKLPNSSVLTFVGQNTLFYMGIHTELKNVLEKIARSFTTVESTEFIVAAVLILFFGLIPLAGITDKYFPFVIGKPTVKLTKKTKLCQAFMTFFAFGAVYYTAVYHLASALIPSLVSTTAAKAALGLIAVPVWAVICYLGCMAVRKILPAAFLIEKPKSDLISSGDVTNS